MQIGQAAAASGVTAKMIRHYEAIGLVPAADRHSSNYRDYGREDVHRLGFIRRARALGFSMDEIRDLLRLWSDTGRSSADVKQLTLAHLAELDARISLLQDMRDTLGALAEGCDGDQRPHCPIIDGLEGKLAAVTGPLERYRGHGIQADHAPAKMLRTSRHSG